MGGGVAPRAEQVKHPGTAGQGQARQHERATSIPARVWVDHFGGVRREADAFNVSFIRFRHRAPTELRTVPPEASMQVILSRWGSHRWRLPILAGIIVPLVLALLPGGPVRILARDVGFAQVIRVETAAVNATGTAFARAHADERDALPRSREGAVSGLRRALASMPDNAVLAEVAALRAAVQTYALSVAMAGSEPGRSDASADAIDAALGLLRTEEEARLREPFLNMRLAEMAFLAERDPRSARLLEQWADTFSTRLNDMALPEGTRTRLSETFAAYEHGVLGANDAVSQNRETRQASARAVESALANADGALIAEQQRHNDAFAAAWDRLWWLFATALLASALAMAGGVFELGRMIFHQTPGHGWSPR
jgi:hypothetical protein